MLRLPNHLVSFITATLFVASACSAQDVVPPQSCQLHEWASVFFDQAPAKTASPLVLRVTVTRLFSGSPHPGTSVEACIDQVLKGSVEGDRVRIDTRMTRCPIEMKIGDAGMVRGQPDKRGGIRPGEIPNIIVQLNRPFVAN
jgi:hypothetical protein